MKRKMRESNPRALSDGSRFRGGHITTLSIFHCTLIPLFCGRNHMLLSTLMFSQGRVDADIPEQRALGS